MTDRDATDAGHADPRPQPRRAAVREEIVVYPPTSRRGRVVLGAAMTTAVTCALVNPATAEAAAESRWETTAASGESQGGLDVTWKRCPQSETGTAGAEDSGTPDPRQATRATQAVQAVQAVQATRGAQATQTTRATQAALDRLDCATVTVPLDYANPGASTVNISISRLRATKPTKRRGVLLLNWGGPGWSGTRLPIHVATSRAGALSEEFDLIGFDPRGTGDSGAATCPKSTSATTRPAEQTRSTAPTRLADPSLSPKERAQLESQRFAAALAECASADPARTRNLTIQNVARDMERIRTALGERRLNYLGVSWGTRLGAAYRTMFPERVDRMLLDSVLPPIPTLLTSDLVPPMEQSFWRFSEYLAANDGTYHLGPDPATVRSTLLGLRDRLNAAPFEVDGGAIGGDVVVLATISFRNTWSIAGRLVAAVRSGDRSETIAAAHALDEAMSWPSPGVRERYNKQVNMFMWCNEAVEPGDFEFYWDTHERQAARYPMAGQLSPTHGDCTGWPYPPAPIELRRQPGSLQLVAHTDEWNTPPAFAERMRDTVGGALAYVDDDAHGSLVNTPCAEQAVRYLRSGHTFIGHCAGLSPAVR